MNGCGGVEHPGGWGSFLGSGKMVGLVVIAMVVVMVEGVVVDVAGLW